MDLSYPEDVERFRVELRAILQQELPAGWTGIGGIDDLDDARRFTTAWRDVLFRQGLLGLTWPTEYGGRGLSKLHHVVLLEELTRVGAPYGVPGDTFGMKMLANTLLHWGSKDQKARFLPRILSGEDRWCQGYSEPEAGSDLAALRTSAVLEGQQWVVTGQKVWTSAALDADWCFVLARTDPGAPAHRGISFLLVPLDQRAVEIRPIRQLTGASEFNEIFFTGARTSVGNIVGPLHGGWKVAMTLLAFERGEEAATNPILFRAELDRLVAMAHERGRTSDPLVRQRLAWCYGRVEMMRWLGYRILTRWLAGDAGGAESSVAKLYWSEYHQAVTELALDVLGVDALTLDGRGPLRAYRTDDPGARNTSGSWTTVFLNARAGTIYAGATEVQLDILAEQVLGLPKERRSPAP